MSVLLSTSSTLDTVQVLLGGLSHCTVGLVATFMAVLCIVASDTGAYFFGKSFGKTQLIAISPKKTVEGALGTMVDGVDGEHQHCMYVVSHVFLPHRRALV